MRENSLRNVRALTSPFCCPMILAERIKDCFATMARRAAVTAAGAQATTPKREAIQ